MLEAESRGILPDDKKPLLEEARKRGLVPAGASLGEQIGGFREQELAKRAQTQQDPYSQESHIFQGIKEGLLRQPMQAPPSGPGLMHQAGHALGQYGPMVAGSVAAGALGPAGILGSAASQFAGTGLGEAGGLGLSKMMGGNAPSSMSQLASESAKTGLGAAIMDLGINIPLKAISMIPEVANVFLRIPSESIKRMIKNPDMIPTKGKAQQFQVETNGINAIAKIQDKIQAQRSAVGQTVDDALESLHNATKGKKLFDVGPLAKDAKDYMINVKQINDSTVRASLSNDFKKILDIVNSMRENPMKSARSMVQIRRELDFLADHDPAGVPRIQSDAGQDIIKKLANDFRSVIHQGADLIGETKLGKANANFHDLATSYDELRPIIGTKDQGRKALIDRFGSLEGLFNAGGVKQDLLNEIGRKFPGTKKDVESLMNHIAANAFTKSPLPTVSGLSLDMIRLLGSPQAVGVGIKAGSAPLVKKAGQVAKGAARVGGAGIAQKFSEPRQ